MKQDSLKTDTVIYGKHKKVGDSLEVTSDQPVKRIENYAKRYNPRRASLLAAVMPGVGQIYTKRYWKAPLVWGGFGLLIYAVSFSQTQYTHYKGELFQTINQPNTVLKDGLGQEQLRTIVDAARRQRDYFLIINFFWYMLQIVDAHVDAHLKEFKVNPQLQVRIESVSPDNSMLGRNTAVAFVYKF